MLFEIRPSLVMAPSFKTKAPVLSVVLDGRTDDRGGHEREETRSEVSL